ncbi:MAG: histidine phosphatase family protein [Candidatus Protistobacter heckmanni]|nr:histidine phosphatase family protein [Candidatus Protistobacter heckmanni]
MRHGNVTYFDGSGKPILPETVPLNEEGRAQADAAGQAFAAQQVSFDKVIVSGLPRTVETARRVLAQMRQADASLPDLAERMEIWPEWEELRGGKLAEIALQSLQSAFVGAFEGAVAEDKRFLNGESIGEFLERVLPPVQRLREDKSWDIALIVLHGGVNCALLSHALTAGVRLFLGNLAQTPSCINAIDIGEDPRDWVVRMVNYAPPAALHTGSRKTTMESLLEQYLQFRKDLRGMQQ